MDALLIVEDPTEATILSLALKQSNLRVTLVRDLKPILETWPQRPSDLILIAVRTKDPLCMVEQVRTIALAVVPVVIIGELLTEAQRITLLSRGADRVISRPYSLLELAAEVQAFLRRGSSIPLAALPSLSARDVTLDPTTRTVRVGSDSSRRLTNMEYRLLFSLMAHRGEVLSFERLIELVWGYSGEGSHSLLHGLVSRLRRKVEVDHQRPRYILNIPGVGYSFVGDQKA